MPKKCDHNIPESRKGSGPCSISSEVKKRTGKPLWWCSTHGLEAGAPDGTALAACPGSWFDRQPAPSQLELKIDEGAIRIWGALPPALVIGNCQLEPGGVHVHQRLNDAGDKSIDNSFDIVRLHAPDGTIVEIEAMAAKAFAIADLSGRTMNVLTCPKKQCGFRHIDELKFATHPHVKHQCNGCGRNFWDKTPSIGNPLVDAQQRLGLATPPAAEPVDRPLALRSTDWSGIAVWPSNHAIVTTSTTAEDTGLHVHAWNHDGDLVLDDTYNPVTLDDRPLDHAALRALTVQQALAHGAPIIALACHACSTSMISPSTGWIEPVTKHACHACGAITKTRRRVMINPYGETSGE